MKFSRFFKKEQPELEQKEIQVIEEKRKIDFTDEMFLEIAEMKLRIENIAEEKEIYEELKSLIDTFERYIEKASEKIEEDKIQDKIRSIQQANIVLELEPNDIKTPQTIIDRVYQELSIEDYYNNIKTVFDEKYKRATQTILMNKVEKFSKNLDKILVGQENINGIDLNDLNKYFEILIQKKNEFNGIAQNIYIEKLIELEYKISMIKLIDAKQDRQRIYEAKLCEFDEEKANCTQAKKVIWSRLFIANCQEIISKVDNYEIRILEKNLERINLMDKNEEAITKSNIEIYLNGIAKIQRNNIKKQDEKREQELEEKRKQQELEEMEQYKDLTEEEINSKIKELDEDKFDIVTSYKNIIDYQIKVGKAKGLITDKNILKIVKTEDMQVDRVKRRKVPVIFSNLKNEICNCEIYTDIDDSEKNVYVVTSGSVSKLENNDVKKSDYVGDKKRLKAQFTSDFIRVLNEYIKENNCIICTTDNDLYYYSYDSVYNAFQSMNEDLTSDKENNADKIKFYIELPYRRTIIPILEELKQNEIDYTILSMENDKQARMNNPCIKIYMNRSDLEKYKQNVHGKISTIEKGIIKIGEEQVDLWEMIKNGCELPFKMEKNKEISQK